MSEDIRVLIADDDPIIHDSFARLLDSQDGITVVATAPNGAEALTKMTRSIDVALIDVDMPILDGIEAAKLIRKSYPQTTIIMLTAFEHEDSLAQALAAGVQGFLTKNTTPKEIAEYLKKARAGTTVFDTRPTTILTESYTEKALTQAQYTDFINAVNTLPQRLQPVFTQLLDAKTNKEIAQELHMSPTTVRSYVSEILAHTGCKSRGQLAITAARAGITQ
ncbi:DNA-binding NarL/FixJ family response regulator [Mobiluncus mulieris]|uniref:Response regulator protein vraR n=5 Tax=Mobiluncus mulieris TaxID=2052 RepID=A0A8G2HSE7_9ACTO|nr:response regulator transcription factor [Mobiluncus mulieris]MBB5845250.1 DNA-binding NarL/FixJ family response regulator [Mobiluncus mulieris]PNL42998.1 DNA-binding response regulator [Mobiluncus mulieris]STO16073.1 Response regulator protein vraR [Mobiluncus mulieris]